jgi:hypothetical protein
MVEKIRDIETKCFRNSQEIAKYIGESHRNIASLVIEEQLPAWKRNGKGPWRAIDYDLDRWLIAQRHKYLSENIKSALEEIEKKA